MWNNLSLALQLGESVSLMGDFYNIILNNTTSCQNKLRKSSSKMQSILGKRKFDEFDQHHRMTITQRLSRLPVAAPIHSGILVEMLAHPSYTRGRVKVSLTKLPGSSAHKLAILSVFRALVQRLEMREAGWRKSLALEHTKSRPTL